jgi:hypothetical protein
MEVLMNILLIVPAILPKGKTPVEMYNDSGFAIVAFLAFLVLLYLILSPGKAKKSRIRNDKSKF